MSLATETDPRETVKLMLDDEAADSDYSNAGSKPGKIEVVEQSPRNTKENRSGDAIYIWSPADEDIGKFEADGSEKQETVVIQAEAWSMTSATQAENLSEDIQSIVGGYANDSKSNTQWVDVYPISGADHRNEKNPRSADHYIEVVQIQLMRTAAL